MSGVGSNTSATGGYIVPTAPPAPSEDEFLAAIQGQIAALSRLPGALVRPRWQPMAPAQPDAMVTWGAVGITMVEADEYPMFRHVGDTVLPGETNPGYSIIRRNLTLTVTVSFYGPGADECAGLVRDGLYVPQNYEPLASLGLKLLTVHDLARAPELINQQWINRVDLRLEYRTQLERTLPIFDLAGADVDLISETAEAPVTVRPDTVLRP